MSCSIQIESGVIGRMSFTRVQDGFECSEGYGQYFDDSTADTCECDQQNVPASVALVYPCPPCDEGDEPTYSCVDDGRMRFPSVSCSRRDGTSVPAEPRYVCPEEHVLVVRNRQAECLHPDNQTMAKAYPNPGTCDQSKGERVLFYKQEDGNPVFEADMKTVEVECTTVPPLQPNV